MTDTVIIIPSRLGAERLPNKPLKLINNKEMILHVYDSAARSNIGKVYVATPDKEIFDLVENHGGKAFISKKEHLTGTDRIYEIFDSRLKKKPDIIINLQGDMPNIDHNAIKFLESHVKKNLCEIATLASNIENDDEYINPNIVKLVAKNEIKEGNFSNAVDFFRISREPTNKQIYHHIGIYAFTNKALIRYVSLKRSKLEIERKLEQLRALENNIKIDFSCIKACPLSVDTEEDLIKIRKIMKTKK